MVQSGAGRRTRRPFALTSAREPAKACVNGLGDPRRASAGRANGLADAGACAALQGELGPGACGIL